MKKLLFPFLFMAVLLCGRNLQAQIFITFSDGLKGESDAPAHKAKDETEIQSFKFGANNAPTIASATGGAGAGRVKMEEITFLKPRGPISNELFKAVCAGKHFATAKILFYNPGGSSPWLTITLTNVFISSMSLSASGGEMPMESIAIAFGAISFEDEYAGKNSIDPKPPLKTRSAWNVVLNRENIP